MANSGRDNKTEYIDGIRIERVGVAYTLASAPLCPAMISRIRHSDADLVHIHLPNPTAVLAYLASGCRRPLVVTYHSDTIDQVVLGALFNPILHRFLARSKAILVTSPNYLDTSPRFGETSRPLPCCPVRHCH